MDPHSVPSRLGSSNFPGQWTTWRERWPEKIGNESRHAFSAVKPWGSSQRWLGSLWVVWICFRSLFQCSWHSTIWVTLEILLQKDNWYTDIYSYVFIRWGFASITKVYWTSKTKANGSKSWQGGKDLASTAMFTQDFCNHLLLCWEKRLEPDAISVLEKPAKHRLAPKLDEGVRLGS